MSASSAPVLPPSYAWFIEMVDELRKRGAVEVRAGEYAAVFATPATWEPAAPYAGPPDESANNREPTPDELLDAEEQEYVP